VNEIVGYVALFGGLALYFLVLYPTLLERLKPRLHKVKEWSERDSDKKD
jgi:hypothetical protein